MHNHVTSLTHQHFKKSMDIEVKIKFIIGHFLSCLLKYLKICPKIELSYSGNINLIQPIDLLILTRIS